MHSCKRRLCGHPERMETAVRRARTSVTWRLQGTLLGLKDSDFRAAIQSAFDSWSAVCNVSAREALKDESPDLVVKTGQVDGPGEVLAWCELPTVPNKRQLARVDDAEAWMLQLGPLGDLSHIDLHRVLRHELGHFWGLGHSQNPGALMYPNISAVIDRPQNSDFQAMLALGYVPAPTPAPPKPAPPPTPTKEPLTIKVYGDGQIEITGYKVSKL